MTKLNFPPKRKHHRSKNAQERNRIIPPERLAQIKVGKYHEHQNRDRLLNDLELVSGELPLANPVGRDLKTVLAKRNQPTDRNHQRQRGIAVFQVPIPGKRHKSIRDQKQNYRKH